MSGYTRQRIDQGFERRFLIGLIVDDRFVREAEQLYKPDFVESQSIKTVAGWCFDYFKRYEKAPSRHIQDIFDENEDYVSEDLQVFIGGLLDQLSAEWEHTEKFNTDYLLDEAEKFFKGKSLLALASGIRESVNAGDLLRAEELHATYNTVQRQKSIGVNPFTDVELIERAISTSEDEPLFKLPGTLGEIINPQLYREALIAFQGPEKIGKSFWADEIAIRSLRCRCNTVLFDFGDSSEEQRTARLHSHIAERPLKRFHKNGGFIKVPVLDCIMNQQNSCSYEYRTSKIGVMVEDEAPMDFDIAAKLGYKPCSRCNRMKGAVWYELRKLEPLTASEAIEKGKEFFIRARGKHFKMKCYENSSMNIKGVNSQLEVWKHQEGFVPDVIILDYPAIMAPENPKQDQRNRVNDTWKAMRALAQRWKACVVTFDQTDADSYGKEEIKLKNFSEDKRKYGHVTAMYAFNQTDEERERGIMRIGELLVREGATVRSRKIHVLECRAIGKINLGSYL